MSTSQQPPREPKDTAGRSRLSDKEIRRRLGRIYEMALAAAARTHQTGKQEAGPNTDLTTNENGCTIDAS